MIVSTVYVPGSIISRVEFVSPGTTVPFKLQEKVTSEASTLVRVAVKISESSVKQLSKSVPKSTTISAALTSIVSIAEQTPPEISTVYVPASTISNV